MTNLFKKFCTGLITGLVKVLVGLLDQLYVSQYINISTYRPLVGISYINLPAELKIPKKALININNNDQKCFLWCHVRHVNPVKRHPERITEKDKEIVHNLDYRKNEFPVSNEDFLIKSKRKMTFALMSFVMKIN